MTSHRHRLPLVQALLAGATGLAVGAAAGAPEGLLAFAIVAAMSLGLHLARRRSETAAVLSGLGDERVRSLSLTAAAWTACVMAAVLVGWWLVGLATGEENPAIGALCAIFALSWVACAGLARLRG